MKRFGIGLRCFPQYLLVGMVLLISSCSFHSSQYDMLKALFSDTKFSIQTWSLTWQGSVVEVFPIALGAGRILFVNERGVRVEFDGWNLVGFEGLTENFGGKLIYRIILLQETDSNSNVTSLENNLEAAKVQSAQYDDGTNEQIIYCGPWEQDSLSPLGKNFSQNCFFSSSEPFQNAIIMDDKSKISRIETYLLPGKQAIRLSRQD